MFTDYYAGLTAPTPKPTDEAPTTESTITAPDTDAAPTDTIPQDTQEDNTQKSNLPLICALSAIGTLALGTVVLLIIKARKRG